MRPFAVFAVVAALAFAASAEPATAGSGETYNGIRAWNFGNDKVTLIVTPGGGHIASMALNSGRGKGVNPLWLPPWKSVEPGQWKSKEKFYGDKPAAQLLSCILGHNLCLDFFGAPSAPESKAGLPVHGEAPCVTWKLGSRTSSRLTYSARLPDAQMDVTRTISLKPGSSAIWITETVENLSSIDRPFGWQQHVTLGSPFLKEGESFTDLSGKWSKVYPKEFSKDMRLEAGSEFEWPEATGSDGGTVDLRDYPKGKKTSDFTVTLATEGRKWAWFTAVNVKKGVVIGYVWPRKVWPWIANWEENRARTGSPWNGKAITRGIEFGTSPWPDPRREQVTANRLNGTLMYRWISAREKQTVGYGAFVAPIPAGTTGVSDVNIVGSRIVVALSGVEKKLSLPFQR